MLLNFIHVTDNLHPIVHTVCVCLLFLFVCVWTTFKVTSNSSSDCCLHHGWQLCSHYNKDLESRRKILWLQAHAKYTNYDKQFEEIMIWLDIEKIFLKNYLISSWDRYFQCYACAIEYYLPDSITFSLDNNF